MNTMKIVNENSKVYMDNLAKELAMEIVDELNDPDYAPVFLMTPQGLWGNNNNKPHSLQDYEFPNEKDAWLDLFDGLKNELGADYEDDAWANQMIEESYPVRFRFSAVAV